MLCSFICLLAFTNALFANSDSGYSNIPTVDNASGSHYSNISNYISTSNDPSLSNEEQNLEQCEEERCLPIEDTAANDPNQEDHELQQTNNQEGPLLMACGPWTYTGKLKADDDGTGPSHNPKHSNETSFKRNGISLNADTDSYVEVPNCMLKYGVRKGDRADVYFRIDFDAPARSMHQLFYISSIVGDVGRDEDGFGEVSINPDISY